jgi:hypothetical protein
MADRLAERIRRDGAESLRGADWSELASLAARSAEVDSLWIIGADGRLMPTASPPNPLGPTSPTASMSAPSSRAPRAT